MTDPEPRTVRELRVAIREAERALERLHMAPAVALSWGPEWYLRKARLALRQAERAAAASDDPRLPELRRLRAQLRDPAPRIDPPRRRYRCPACFRERLFRPDERPWCGRCLTAMEPVTRRR